MTPEKAMGEFKDQLEAGEREKVTKLIQELLEVASKGQAGDESITPGQHQRGNQHHSAGGLGLFRRCTRTERWRMSPKSR